MSATTATTYLGLHSVAPDGYKGTHRRRHNGSRTALAILGTIWLAGLTIGSLTASGVTR